MARQLWDLLTTPYERVPGKPVFVKTAADMIYHKKIDRKMLDGLIDKILHSRAQRRRIMGIPRDGQFALHAKTAGALMGARHETMMMIDDIDDSTFEWARFFYHVHLRSHLKEQLSLAKSVEWGHLFPKLTENEIVSFACRDLVDTLGIAPLMNATHGTILNPETWRKHELRFNDNGEVVTASGEIFTR